MSKTLWIYIALLGGFTIFSYAFVDKNLIYLKSLYSGLYLNNRTELSFIFVLLVTSLFSVYYFIAKDVESVVKVLPKLLAGIVMATFLSYPAALTFDIFNYITTAKVAYFYHENPYLIYPIELTGEPYLLFTRAANKLALYGPVWIALTAIPFYLGFGNFVLTLFSFKLLIVVFYLATVYVMFKMDKRAATIFALNPLVIIETLVSSHNDIVLVFFAILAYYLIKNQIVSGLLLVASILIKFATAFLVPVYLLALFGKLRESRLYFLSALSMVVIFSLSPLREELYPWYAIWFLAFTAFLRNKFIQNLIIVFSFSLMLRYIPYMATGNYFGTTPMIRVILTTLPVGIYLFVSYFKKQIKFDI